MQILNNCDDIQDVVCACETLDEILCIYKEIDDKIENGTISLSEDDWDYLAYFFDLIIETIKTAHTSTASAVSALPTAWIA